MALDDARSVHGRRDLNDGAHTTGWSDHLGDRVRGHPVLHACDKSIVTTVNACAWFGRRFFEDRKRHDDVLATLVCAVNVREQVNHNAGTMSVLSPTAFLKQFDDFVQLWLL